MLKKIALSALVFALFLSQSIGLVVSAPLKKANYTVFVYMVGSDLESNGAAATNDLLEMMKAESNAGVNVIVQTGGSTQWHTKGISAQSTQRWKVTKGKLTKLNGNLGLLDMASPNTLTDFIRFGVANFPANQYGMVLWNHGAGAVNGFGSDDLFDGDTLTLSELKSALSAAKSKTNVKFEWIGFDACLMATLETAYTLAPFANYMVGSEELEPNHGWDYKPILNALIRQPTIKGAAIGKVISDGFYNQAYANQTDEEITLSVIQLDQIKPLISAMESWVRVLNNDLTAKSQLNWLAKQRNIAESFGKGSNPEDNSDMVDLGDLALRTSAKHPAESEAVIRAVKNAVKSKLTSVLAPHATGLSVYFPYWDQDNFESNLDVYSTVGMSSAFEDLIWTFSDGILSRTTGVELPDSNLTNVKGQNGNADLTQFVIPKNQLDDVSDAYSVLGKYLNKEETKTLMLGLDNDIDFNEDTGVLSSQWSGEWVTLNGSFITMDIDQQYDDHAIYTVPALLNNEDVDLYVDYNYDSDTYKILGAWEGIDEKTNVVDRDITKLKKGDVIVPLLEVYDEKTGKTTYQNGTKLIFSKTTKIERNPLPKGAYTFGFAIEDFAQNMTYTDFDVYDVTE